MTAANLSSLKSQVVDRAAQLGFHSCRVARCKPPAHEAEYREWLREGAAGEMLWMERTEGKRLRPTVSATRRVFRDCPRAELLARRPVHHLINLQRGAELLVTRGVMIITN